MFYLADDVQWLLGKFAYGITDKDLEDENVDIYVQRDCSGDWEYLGTAATTEENAHATIEGVEDTGGRIYFEIPPDDRLELGRHRVHMVVQGDVSTTDGFVEIVDPETPFFLSDVDGTLTTSENEEFADLLAGQIPDANPFAAQAFQILVDKGYHPMYLTARPEWLVERTREFVDLRGFPPGIVHTTTVFDGATGDAAITYKTAELQMLADRTLVPTWTFGNTETDAQAYENGNIQPLDHRVFFQYTDVHGGRRIESYAELVDEFEALPDLCD
jgi:phosphatidate phosphatase PAH1